MINIAQVITDGLSVCSPQRRSDNKTNHVRHIHLKGDVNNNKMKRLNGTIHDREKMFRGLGHMNAPVFDDMKVHYNHVRKHGAIRKTLAEATGITTGGRSKRHTLIQNSNFYPITIKQRV